MKQLKLSLIILCCMLFVLGCEQKREPEYLFRVSLWANEDHTWFKAFQYFDQILHERSSGRISVEIYPSEQLAKELESIRLIQAEVIDMTVTASLLSNWIEIAAFCEMPFLLRDSLDKDLLLNGPLGERIKSEILAKTGLRPVATFERGPRQLTSNRAIFKPEDLQGLIVRVPSVPTFVTAWSAMGAKPTPMAFSEVFTSLQQGTIEAQENPFSLILTAGFAEVQKYVILTEHVMSWSYPVIGEKQFQRLPEELKEIFLKAALDMQAYEHQLFLEQEKSIQQALQQKGMEFIEVDKSAFAAQCQEAIYKSLSPAMQAVYQDFVNTRHR
ncbi:MAG: TRAP transporter substrate-binding protein [Bacteroidota bacterium]